MADEPTASVVCGGQARGSSVSLAAVRVATEAGWLVRLQSSADWLVFGYLTLGYVANWLEFLMDGWTGGWAGGWMTG